MVSNEEFKKYERMIYDCMKKLKIYRDKEDYYQIGAIGLIRALETYDESKGFTKSTYFYKCISNEICREIKKENALCRGGGAEVVSLNAMAKGKEIELFEIIGSNVDVNKEYEVKEKIKTLKKIVESLKPRDKEIMKYHLGLDDYPVLNQREIGEMLGLTRSYVGKLICNNLDKIKKELDKW